MTGISAAERAECTPWVETVSPGRHAMVLLVPDIHCAGCISRIERILTGHPGVLSARVNFSTKRVRVEWAEGSVSSQALVDLLADAGFAGTPVMPDQAGSEHEKAEMSALLRALAVAGFAAGNIMLLSVSVWSGAEAATQDLFHYLSAMIAIPAVAYSGQPFFRSAITALKARRLNMDVPISLAVLLALALSLFETVAGGGETYFDAGVMLLFFLLIGRTLDRMMRTRARSAASGLLALKPDVATIVDEHGANRIVATHTLRPGMQVRIATGERIPADGRIVAGSSDVDCALLTGESLPETVQPGSFVHAGTMNMTAPVTMAVEAVGGDTLVSEIAATMEAAEQSKARTVRIADRAAQIYAPAVHLAALATFLGWLFVTGDWHAAALAAIAVLIITCPCALGLAVPAVQVVASGLLFGRGILLKDGGALERLAEVDSAVFDKTGTLTLGRPQMLGEDTIDPESLAIAAGLASSSNHPLSRAIVRAASRSHITPVAVSDISETPGSGLAGTMDGKPVRLGSRAWCGGDRSGEPAVEKAFGLELWLSDGTGKTGHFRFSDEPRPKAAVTLQALADRRLSLGILSGDRAAAVRQMAAGLGIDNWRADLSPQNKLDHIESMAAEGHKVLVVGDGLNDGPALAAGHVSMAPSSASDLGQTAADLVFLGDALKPVADAHDIARKAGRLVRQNFAFAALYNVIAVPLAAAGLVTPLIAAVAMSSSSLIVIANALRLRMMAGAETRTVAAAPVVDQQPEPVPANRQGAPA